jgi:5-methylcytosine-specific restriction endonuclease McrA
MNIENKRAYDKKWRENHPNYFREWKECHPGYMAKAYEKWRKDDPVRANKRCIEWVKEHPEKSRIYSRDRRAKEINAPGNGWSVKEEKQLIEDYGHRCAYCGNKTDNLTMDHVVPISIGGAHSIENIVPACGSCNSSKNNNPLLVWMYKLKQEA